jgi:hypothetical protein
MHTPETKSQSNQWLKKWAPGPVKAKIHASRTKQMVMAFFDSQGMVYTNYVPRGKTMNADGDVLSETVPLQHYFFQM